MSSEHCNTEALIKEQSKILFFQKGNLKATVQEIADFAGVKRTLVNYYFRSKENLFCIVYHELIEEMKRILDNIYKSEVDFEQKVDQLIDYFFETKIKFPYLEVFNIQESNNIFKLKSSDDNNSAPQPLKHLGHFVKEIEEAMERGIIKKYNPINFLINIISLISFPIIMKPIFTRIYALDDAAYTALLQERKTMIKQTLFN